MDRTDGDANEVFVVDPIDEEIVTSDEDRNHVKREVARIREFVSNLSIDDLKSGDWFVKLLAFSLNQYVTQVDANYFKKKYPNLPPDAVVDARIKMAANYAAIEGALSSFAYTGVVAATIGTGGGASPLTLPAGGASFAIDLSYTSYLQLRMTHDISVLYGVPLDLNDPDDTWKLVKLAFGVKAGETAGGAVMKGLPAFIRPVMKKVFSGATLAALKSLPVVGKYLLQRNIIKFTIPGVTVPLTTAVNRWMTKAAGERAKISLCREAQIIEASRRIVAQAENVEAVLAVLWWIINIDKTVQDKERLLLHYLTVSAEQSGNNSEDYQHYIESFKSQIEVDEEDLWERISSMSAEGAPYLYRAAVIASAVDGKINKQELDLLEILAERLGLQHDKKLIYEIECQWK
ncbi:hypothetical protein [Schaalia suimastitidis]|uniref:hypothetical protein n=1 Tax=Schaalia suimastitidis TaxID=121163 RepID=UPI0004151031|nr:hypothetical protein [Schaalia suimastitidis]